MPLSGPWKSNSAGTGQVRQNVCNLGQIARFPGLNPENISPIAPDSASSHPSYSL